LVHDFCRKKSGSLRAAYKEAKGRECFSGKAMQGVEVEACAKTLVEEMSKNLEEG
jgi:hypothetical protein